MSGVGIAGARIGRREQVGSTRALEWRASVRGRVGIAPGFAHEGDRVASRVPGGAMRHGENQRLTGGDPAASSEVLWFVREQLLTRSEW